MSMTPAPGGIGFRLSLGAVGCLSGDLGSGHWWGCDKATGEGLVVLSRAQQAVHWPRGHTGTGINSSSRDTLCRYPLVPTSPVLSSSTLQSSVTEVDIQDPPSQSEQLLLSEKAASGWQDANKGLASVYSEVPHSCCLTNLCRMNSNCVWGSLQVLGYTGEDSWGFWNTCFL